MSDPTGLGKHQDGSLIYQYVAARNWWKYWPGIDAVFDDSDFTSCFDNRESAESRHMTFLKQPTIWFSLAVYHDTLKWYLYHACWVQFYKFEYSVATKWRFWLYYCKDFAASMTFLYLCMTVVHLWLNVNDIIHRYIFWTRVLPELWFNALVTSAVTSAVGL